MLINFLDSCNLTHTREPTKELLWTVTSEETLGAVKSMDS